jgi:hypothetical protein
MSSRITINGVTVDVEGHNVSVANGILRVDGCVVQEGLTGVVTIKWEGDLANLQADSSVECNDVQGNVSAGGSIHCENIRGSVNAGGSIHCNDVAGPANAGGNIKANTVGSVRM